LAWVTLLLPCICTYFCLCCTSCTLRALNKLLAVQKKIIERKS
jgi:hypothetical protein